MLFADLRAISVATGQNPPYQPIFLAGGDAIADGRGGFFVWHSTSTETANDDWIKPNNLTTTQAGRWQRVLFAPAIGTWAGSMCEGNDVRIPVQQEDIFLASVDQVNYDFRINPPNAGKVILASNLRVEGTITLFDGVNTKLLTVGPVGYTDLIQTASGTTTAAARVISMRKVLNTATENPGLITFSGIGASKVYNLLAVRDLAGTAPVVQSVTETVFSSDVTAHPIDMPATVTSGNLLLMLFTTDAAPTITTPSGWTHLYTLSNGTAVTGSVFAKVATGSEGGTTVNVATSAAENAAAQVWRISSWSGSLAGVAVGTPGSITTGSTVDIPALTPAFGAGETLWIIVLHTSSGQTVVSIDQS